MKFSYAQNFEDVILARLFSSVEHGTYIDVGANHPVQDSVTKVFYDEGWRGVNIEPMSEYFQLLESFRPDDINIKQCASNVDGETIQFVEVGGTGLSTGIIARENELGEDHQIRTVSVTTCTLNSVWKEHHLQDVHFLKVDVEGMESNVLEGLDLALFRPWVLIIESVDSGSLEPNYGSWEPRVLENDYNFMYFDGLNRVYAAQERAAVLPNKIFPPNITDELVSGLMHIRNRYVLDKSVEEGLHFQIKALAAKVDVLEKNKTEFEHQFKLAKAKLAQSQRRCAVLESEVHTLESAKAKLAQSERRCAVLESEVHTQHALLNSIQSSGLWKATFPYRYLKTKLLLGTRLFRVGIQNLRDNGAIDTVVKVKLKLFRRTTKNGNGSDSHSLKIGDSRNVLSRRETQIYRKIHPK